MMMVMMMMMMGRQRRAVRVGRDERECERQGMSERARSGEQPRARVRRRARTVGHTAARASLSAFAGAQAAWLAAQTGRE